MSALPCGAADVKGMPVPEIRYAFYNGGKVTDIHMNRWTESNPNPNAAYPRLSMKDSQNPSNFQLLGFRMQFLCQVEKPAGGLYPS